MQLWIHGTFESLQCGWWEVGYGTPKVPNLLIRVNNGVADAVGWGVTTLQMFTRPKQKTLRVDFQAGNQPKKDLILPQANQEKHVEAGKR